MRIIGGALKGRKLAPIKGASIRPTSDYLRESLFNILADRVQGAIVLDLFAGTGAIGIEALSRGADFAVFVDQSPVAIRVLRRNVSECGLAEKARIFQRSVTGSLAFLKRAGWVFTLVFADPPYDENMAERSLQALHRAECTAAAATVVVEHSAREALPESVASFVRVDQRRHGKTFVSFYEYGKNYSLDNEGSNLA